MLSFSPLSRKDLPQRITWLNDPILHEQISDEPFCTTTLSLQLDWFYCYERSDRKRFFTILYSGEPIGWCGCSDLDLAHGRSEIFLAIAESSHRGKGHGKEALDWLLRYAFGVLHLRKVVLSVFTDNAPALALYVSAGFHQEGLFRDEVLSPKGPRSMYRFALFQDEYIASLSTKSTQKQ